MITAKCPACGATIEVDETKSQFCTNCGKPVAAKNVASNIKTATNTTSTNQATAKTSGFDRLVSQYNSYVNAYDTNLHPVLDMYRAYVELIDLRESAERSRSHMESKIYHEERARQEYNRRADIYNNAVFFEEKEERDARESVHSYREDYDRAHESAWNAHQKAVADTETYNKKVHEYEQLVERMHNTALKMHQLAFDTVDEMLEKYPNNPISQLYLADFYRREVLWMHEICKKAIDYIMEAYDDEYYAEDLYNYFKDKVKKDENYELFKENFAKANSMLGKTVSAQYAAIYNEIAEFSRRYNTIVYDTNRAIEQIEKHHNDVWKKQERTKKRKKWRNTLIILAILAAIGVALYFFVFKQ